MNTIELTPENIPVIGAAFERLTTHLRERFGYSSVSEVSTPGAKLFALVWTAPSKHETVLAATVKELEAKIELMLSPRTMIEAKRAEAAKLLAEADKMEATVK